MITVNGINAGLGYVSRLHLDNAQPCKILVELRALSFSQETVGCKIK